MLTVRRATAADCRKYWEWANDPAVRAASFSQGPIAWTDHQRWFAARLASSTILFVVIDAAGDAIGQVRFEPDADAALEIGVSIAAEYRGRRFASEALAAACRAAKRDRGNTPIIARVRADNVASLRAFLAAGFESVAAERVGDAEAIRLELPLAWT